MLSPGQVAHFKSFGYPPSSARLFSADQEAIHSGDHRYRGQPVAQAPQRSAAGPRTGPGGRELHRAGRDADEDGHRRPHLRGRRVHPRPRLFVWAGSEGNVTVNSEHPWHPDRPGDHDEVSYTRLKLNLYLDPIREENGCLRVIPGSHRMPLHRDIEPDSMHQRRGLPVRPIRRARPEHAERLPRVQPR